MKRPYPSYIFCLCTKIFVLLSFIANAQYATIYPTNWFTGMKWNKVQLLMKGNDASFGQQKISVNYPGINIEKVNKLDNDNGLFLCIDISISPTAIAGNVPIVFSGNGSTHTVNWPLKAKRTGRGTAFAQGITSKDLIYFLMPDRFANGDPSNDSLPGLQEQYYGRNISKGRHGGDIQGITQHLDYIKELGNTTLWLTPVLINDMKTESFHGYAFTDQYTIDPRFGGEKAYHEMIDAAHAKGLKVIQDAVYNHVGINHILVKNKPCKEWLHNWPEFTQTSYKDQPAFDPYASHADYKLYQDGWFTRLMPDLNQGNTYVANYLIQHALWTVEEFGIDGWRIDTYGYNDLHFMNRCNKALMNEYPNITLFGETWVTGTPNQSYFVANNYDIPFKSNLPGVTDFQMLWGMLAGLNEKFGWNEGYSKLYTTLAQDFVYKDPYKNCIFLDNHDLDRIFAVVGKDINKLKQGLTWVLTLRGIPQIYYGTELLMDKFKDPSDAEVRKDVPGGWPGDSTNNFVASGRTVAQNDVFNHIKTLANYRKRSTALQTGKLMQYVPYDGIYVYFRYDSKSTVMVVSNSNETEATVKLGRFEERTKGFTKARNVLTGETTILGINLLIAAKGTLVLELLK
ncbi:MAG: glycoside hydrolase family 13 protein [Chitinophagaceae bacterium]